MLEPIFSEEEYERKVSESSAFLVYYSSPDCGVCKSIRPKLEMLLADFPLVESGYVDISATGEISAQHSIFTIPAVLVYFQGKETIREARYFSIDILAEQIERYLSLLLQ
jgi:thioredoxin-like negative regulator of GroEL